MAGNLVYSQDNIGKISDLGDDFRTYPAISIPFSESQNIEYLDVAIVANDELTSDWVKSIDPKATVSTLTDMKYRFQNKFVEKGSKLTINSYIVGHSILDAYDTGIQRGPDAPSLKDIQDALNSKDTARFVAIVSKLAELRRGPQTRAEGSKAIKNLGPEDWEQSLYFGSGYLEVSGAELPKGGESNTRYFVPIETLTTGASKIDLKTAQLELLKGVMAFAFKRISDTNEVFGEKRPLAKEQSRVMKIENDLANSACIAEKCLQPATKTLGDLVLATYDITRTGEDELYIDDQAELLVFRKQLCLLKFFSLGCPGAFDTKPIDQRLKKEKVDCFKSRTLLIGLKKAM
jgi:hypothetical protein